MESPGNGKVFSRLYVVVTRECNLACKHCYLEAGPGKAFENEITPAEVASIIDTVASDGKLAEVSITGGEPLARKDIKEILTIVLERGVLLNLETNGTLITPGIAQLLSQYKNASVGVSIDGIGHVHDAQRGRPGAFERAVNGLNLLQEYDIDHGISTYVTHENLPQLEEIITLGIETECSIFRILAQTVPLGRSGEKPTDVTLVEKTLQAYFHLKAKYLDDLRIITDLPLALMPAENIDDVQEYVTCPWWKLMGVSPQGDVSLCTALSLHPDMKAGNLRINTFEEIKRHPMFKILDQSNKTSLKGVCGNCHAARICGGFCRAMAFAEFGDLLAPYPMCQAFYHIGKFPEYALIDPEKDCRYP
ncbi:MAG: radical SAM protein [Theionarchaea archaeon]|nr:radical SAM protein [Theionarchaea archaeon]MBU7036392.1 radical SAM protein [Theionarchaea archaeon]